MINNIFFNIQLIILFDLDTLFDASLLIALSICCNMIVLLKGIDSGYLIVEFISLILACDIDEKKVALKIAAFSSFDAIILLNIEIKYYIDMIFI